jgi:hypothetical protein
MNLNKDIFKWDHYSDQPHIIKDKQYKKQLRKKYTTDYLKLFASSLVMFPLSILTMKLFRGSNNSQVSRDFYGIGVNLDKGDIQQKLIEELQATSLLIRVPLDDIKNIDLYKKFAQSFGEDKNITLNIIQSRDTIENKSLLEDNIKVVFDTFEDIAQDYQIGTTINRAKWGFFSVVEYLQFYKTIYDIKQSQYQNISLLGPSVIDFEYHYTIRALFNNYDLAFDKFSALLYVDRRGSPYNTQFLFFDTKNKIDLLYALGKLSPKIKDKQIYITEVNWPLSNTAPYAPTSEKECVSEELYAKYMVEYFDIAKQSNKVAKVFWHQLVAPGYGLVDNRNNQIRKTEAFYKFKQMLNNTKG